LESIQENDLTAIVNRHHICAMRSDIAPMLGMKPIEVNITWCPVDSPSALEQANINKIKAETSAILNDSGAIDAEEIRDQLISDSDNEYNGLSSAARYFGVDESVAMDAIRQEGSQYYVYSERGKKMGGPYDSREAAEKRLRQIEYFKSQDSQP